MYLSICHRAGLALSLWGLAGPLAAEPAPHVTMAWREKPPYHYVENGQEHGFLLARARAVMDEAGLETVWTREPTKRIWANFQNGTKNYCSFGWYRLPQREPYVQFSVPFHVDPPHTVVVAPNAAAAVARHDTLASLLADRNLSIGVVDGVSYGPTLDAMIAGAHNQMVKRTVDPLMMAKMVGAGRVSFMLMDREDWAYFLEKDTSLNAIARRDFRDMPPGLERYIVCSKDVPQEVMGRINKAIDTALKAEARKAGKRRR